MSPEQRRPAMEKLRKKIHEEDVYWWLNQFMHECGMIAEEKAAGRPGHRRARARATTLRGGGA
jgi:trehalose-6-phosphate synthase